jgi:hypothetical protein
LRLEAVFPFSPRNAERFRVEFLKVKGDMSPNIRVRTASFLFAGALLLSVGAGAQQKASTLLQHSRAYDLGREVSLRGTVVEYRPLSSTPPLGAHVTLQTASGIVDVHLGDPRTLAANHFSLAPGDAVSIMGENLNESQGTQFVARLIQKGTQSLAVRSLQGIPLKPGHATANGAQTHTQQGGVL